ncbi:MAG: TlpA family protein disulfide reductase [Candidatus Limnocylindrales bacterium]
MRRPDILGVVAALVVGGILTVLLLASAVASPPALPTPPPPSIPPLPTGTPVAPRTFVPTTPPGESPGPVVTVGEPAPRLQVTLTDGSLFDTADYAGQPLWINFMATWSPQSATELPLMQRYQNDYEDQMTIVAVDVGEDRQTVRQFFNGLDVGLPVGVDEDGTAQAAWGINALPMHVFIDADGVVQAIVYGGAPLEVWDESISLIVPDFVPPSEEPVPQE